MRPLKFPNCLPKWCFRTVSNWNRLKCNFFSTRPCLRSKYSTCAWDQIAEFCFQTNGLGQCHIPNALQSIMHCETLCIKYCNSGIELCLQMRIQEYSSVALLNFFDCTVLCPADACCAKREIKQVLKISCACVFPPCKFSAAHVQRLQAVELCRKKTVTMKADLTWQVAIIP